MVVHTDSARPKLRPANIAHQFAQSSATGHRDVSSDAHLPHVEHQANTGGIHLAELLGVLSLATDLGMGQPMEHMLRQCLIALRLSERMGLDESDRGVVYYTSLLAWVGCNVDAYEQAKWFGDEFVLKADARLVDFTGPAPAMRYLVAGWHSLFWPAVIETVRSCSKTTGGQSMT